MRRRIWSSEGFTLLEILLVGAALGMITMGLSSVVTSHSRASRQVATGGDFESLRSSLSMLVDCDTTLASMSCAAPTPTTSILYNYQLLDRNGGKLLAGSYGSLGDYNLRWYCNAKQQVILEVAQLQGGPKASSPDLFTLNPLSHKPNQWTPLFPTGSPICEVPPPPPPPPPLPPVPGTAGYGTVSAPLVASGGTNCAPWLPKPVRGMHFTATLTAAAPPTYALGIVSGGADCSTGVNGGHLVSSYPIAPNQWFVDCCQYVAPNNKKPPYKTTPLWSTANALGSFKLYSGGSALPQYQIAYGNLVPSGGACGPAGAGWSRTAADVTCPNTQWNLRAAAGGAMCGGMVLSSQVADNGQTWHIDCCGPPPPPAPNAMAVCVLDDKPNIAPY